MELGNMMFGNSRGHFEFPNREIVKCDEWQILYSILNDCGMWNTDRGFSNDVFGINAYYSGSCNCGVEDAWKSEDAFIPHKETCDLIKPNFIHKPSGFSIAWYKYPFRDSYMSHDLSEDEIKFVFRECVDSLHGYIPETPKPMTQEQLKMSLEKLQRNSLYGMTGGFKNDRKNRSEQ